LTGGSIPRQTLLITHANPEDNTVARWLAARLLTAGYKVWVDLRSLKGGQDFWDEIENQLRHHAIKQIVLVSPDIRKQGVKKELALGDVMGRQLGDPNFMIPVRVAPIAHSEFPPELLRRNAIEALPNWSVCLPVLLETLADAGVARGSTPEGDLLANVVAAQEAGRQVIASTPETLLTNWFDVVSPRPVLRMYGTNAVGSQLDAWLSNVSFPFVRHSGLVATFCDLKALPSVGDGAPRLEERFYLPFDELVRGRSDTPFVDRTDARRNITNLMRQHWDMALSRRGLARFEFSAGRVGWFFPDDLVDGAVKAELDEGLRINRVVSGKFKERRWHLCLVGQPRLWPEPLFRVHANIALTENGRVPLPGETTHAVRRRLTRSWWNDKWRDLLLAGMHWLAEGKETFSLAAGDEKFEMLSRPRRGEIGVSYQADERRSTEEDAAGEVHLSEELGADGDEELLPSDDDGEA
jgi:hypothetical protein